MGACRCINPEHEEMMHIHTWHGDKRTHTPIHAPPPHTLPPTHARTHARTHPPTLTESIRKKERERARARERERARESESERERERPSNGRVPPRHVHPCPGPVHCFAPSRPSGACISRSHRDCQVGCSHGTGVLVRKPRTSWRPVRIP